MHIKQERRCVACHNNFNQQDMLRIAKINNEFKIDNNQNLQGRGAYICKNKQCLNQVIKKRLLNKSFKMNINSAIYEELGDYEQNN